MESFEQIKNYFHSLADIPLTEWAYFVSHIEIVHYSKTEKIKSQSLQTRKVGLVVKGLAYLYLVTSEGRLFVKNIIPPGQMLTSFSVTGIEVMQNYNCEFLEETVIAFVSEETLIELLKRHSCWEVIARKSLEQAMTWQENRDFQALKLSHLERYNSFQNRFSVCFEKIPQHLVASYIGLTPSVLNKLIQNKKQI